MSDTTSKYIPPPDVSDEMFEHLRMMQQVIDESYLVNMTGVDMVKRFKELAGIPSLKDGERRPYTPPTTVEAGYERYRPPQESYSGYRQQPIGKLKNDT